MKRRIKMKEKFRAIALVSIGRAFVLILAMALLVFTSSALRADNKDTIDDVVRAGRAAGPGLSTMQAALRDAQAISRRLEDRAFAGRVLEAAKKNDKQGVAALLKTAAPTSQITVKEIHDFCIDTFLCTDNHCYRLCVGDCCKHPSGKTSPVVFSEF
jgi:hypothetical protein